MYRSLLNHLKELFVRPHCPICLRVKRRPAICKGCLLPPTTRAVRWPSCIRCGALERELKDGVCYICSQSAPRWNRFYFLSETNRALIQTVAAMKYHCHRQAMVYFRTWLREAIPCAGISGEEYDMVIPLPTRSSHLFKRGFCLPTIIAHEVTEHLYSRRLTAIEQLALFHTGEGIRQAGAALSRREENVKNAFVAHTRSVEGARVLLVDDIATSGATLGRATRALQAAGADSVSILVVARGKRFLYPPQTKRLGISR